MSDWSRMMLIGRCRIAKTLSHDAQLPSLYQFAIGLMLLAVTATYSKAGTLQAADPEMPTPSHSTTATQYATDNIPKNLRDEDYRLSRRMMIQNAYSDGRSDPSAEGAIWSVSAYAVYAFSKTFAAPTVSGQGHGEITNGPLTTVFSTAFNAGADGDVVTSLNDCVSLVSGGHCIGANAIARTHGRDRSTLTGIETDAEFTSGGIDAGGSAGFVGNVLDIDSKASGMLLGGVNGTWLNGLVMSDVRGSYLSVNSSNKTIAHSFVDKTQGTFSDYPIDIGCGISQSISFGTGVSGGSPRLYGECNTGKLEGVLTANQSFKLVNTAGNDLGSPLTGSCLDILYFGADMTGVKSSDEAFTKAVAAAGSGNVCLYFPAGTYKFMSAKAIFMAPEHSLGSIHISGDGPDLTNLNFANGTSGLTITIGAQNQSVHIRNLSILAGSASTSNTGIEIRQNATSIPNPANSANSDISFVNLHGNDGYGRTNTFGVGIKVISASLVNIHSVNVVGPLATTGVCISAAGTPRDISVVLNISNSNAIYCNVGLQYGNYLQGVSISQSNFTGDNYGIATTPLSTALAQLTVTGSQFNENITDIDLPSSPDGVQIAGNDLYLTGSDSTGVNIQNALALTITGNSFHGLSARQTGIKVVSYAGDASFLGGNTFRNLANGISLFPKSRNVTVGPNAFAETVTTPITNAGTNNTVPTSCSGAPTSQFAVSNGIITHC